MKQAGMLSSKTVGRLSLYRRLLYGALSEGQESVYSHQLASLASVTAAQVRRDIMELGFSGDPNRGYQVRKLVEAIGKLLDSPQGQTAALVGVGNLGRALIAYFSGRRPRLTLVATFDRDPQKVERVIHGCRCYPMDRLEEVVKQLAIQVAILTVPASEAQAVAEQLARAGVRGLLNFAPVPLKVGPDVYVENVDVTMSLEKVAYFARRGAALPTVPE